jgi:hypothetical protein
MFINHMLPLSVSDIGICIYYIQQSWNNNNTILAYADLFLEIVICPDDEDSKNLWNVSITSDIHDVTMWKFIIITEKPWKPEVNIHYSYLSH